MRLDDERESNNIEDQRGSGGGLGGLLPGGGGLQLGGRGLGCGGIAVVIVLALVFGVNPMQLLGGGGPVGQPDQNTIGQPQDAGAPDGARSNTDKFVARVLATTEDTWGRIFKEQVGQAYRDPRLVLFSGSTRSGCGAAQSAMGPFYCPADQKVYLDESFFDELSSRFGAKGDFAAAYVVAHEIGHHVQNQLGISQQAQELQDRSSKTQANAISVRVELQADCLAGVWAKDNANILDPGDVEEAITAATAIGDDTLQRAAQGIVVPESFTHGSSAQRVRWFRQGLSGGTIKGCDTFSARDL